MNPAPAQEPTSPPSAGLAAAWWGARGQILARLGVGAACCGLLLASVYFLRPTQAEARLEFRLLFNGVEEGQYPNFIRFTPADIVAEPVLREVYRRNHLDGVVPFGEFRNAFAVLTRNPALDDYRLEARDRLENSGLTQVERTKLEDEYASRVRALRNGEFVLVGRLPGGWPAGLGAGLLPDILEVWSRQARTQGMFRFNFNIYSDNIIADITPYRDDYLLLLDHIRVTINRVLANIDQLESIPGATLVRAGPRRISLDEVKAQLRDDLKYKLSLIEVPVYGLGLYRNQAFSEAYVNEQLARLKRETAHVQARRLAVERALSSYAASSATPASGSAGDNAAGSGSALMPQLSESFLNRLLDMSSMQADVTFRQELSRRAIALGREQAELENERQIYANILEQLGNRDAAMEERRAAMAEWVGRQSAAMLTTLHDALGNAQALYEEISRSSLEPPAVYVAPDPVVIRRVSPVGLARPALVLALAGAVYACLVLRRFVPRD